MSMSLTSVVQPAAQGRRAIGGCVFVLFYPRTQPHYLSFSSPFLTRFPCSSTDETYTPLFENVCTRGGGRLIGEHGLHSDDDNSVMADNEPARMPRAEPEAVAPFTTITSSQSIEVLSTFSHAAQEPVLEATSSFAATPAIVAAPLKPPSSFGSGLPPVMLAAEEPSAKRARVLLGDEARPAVSQVAEYDGALLPVIVDDGPDTEDEESPEDD